MDKLIEKAIEAIKEDKKDYAIGLLEGAMQISCVSKDAPNVYVNTSDQRLMGGSFGVPNRVIPQTISLERSGEDGLIIDAEASAKLGQIKRLSEESLS